MPWLVFLIKKWIVYVDSRYADKVNTELAGRATVATAESQIRVCLYAVTVLPSAPSVLESCLECVFEGGDSMVDGEMPGVTVLN